MTPAQGSLAFFLLIVFNCACLQIIMLLSKGYFLYLSFQQCLHVYIAYCLCCFLIVLILSLNTVITDIFAYSLSKKDKAITAKVHLQKLYLKKIYICIYNFKVAKMYHLVEIVYLLDSQ